MKKKKRGGFLLFLLLTAAIIGCASYLYFQSDKLPMLQYFVSNDGVVDTVRQLLGGEPQEVRRLRKMEVASSDGEHYEYYFSQLSEEEKRCYRVMLDGIRDRKEQFYITLSGDEEVNRVYKAVLLDHPELYWIHNREHVYRTVFGDSSYCLFNPGYTYTEEEMHKIDASMEDAFRQIEEEIGGKPGLSTYDKIEEVYKYVIDNTDYVSTEHDQNIAGVFWQKEAVCAGYAGAVQYLLDRLDIPCIYVEGSAEDTVEGHAWNIVEIDGSYYYVDATNGDQPDFLSGEAASLEEHKTIIMDYLCPFPDEYELTYTPAGDFPLPDCTETTYNFYRMNNACFDIYNREAVMDLCRSRIQNEAAVLRFKFTTEEAFQQAQKDLIEQKDTQDIAQYYMLYHNLEYVEYHSGTLDTLKTMYFIF